MMLYFLGYLTWIIVICLTWDDLSTRSYTFLLELLFFFVIHTFKSHAVEMLARKNNNRKKIMDVEIEKTSRLLNNLVPPPVLQGIRND